MHNSSSPDKAGTYWGPCETCQGELEKRHTSSQITSKMVSIRFKMVDSFLFQHRGKRKKLDKMVVKESPNAPNFVPDYILEMAQSNLAESQQVKSPSTESESEEEDDDGSHMPVNTRSEYSQEDDENSKSSS
eukprot:TRINITY_DN1469_c0_g1_i4.p1 TRINITY_DN1469_c0_g1~~TRINITY_DN1469_c0_g1_i4.p1  ORF type:complete len:132 (-),score=19.21 TRINITY_DN1469_c0_g1_i4:75-470(-)